MAKSTLKESQIDEYYWYGHDTDSTEESVGANQFQTAYDWIKMFGGKELLMAKYIQNGHGLLKALKNGEVSIEEIDNATQGEHGQANNLAFSETKLGKNFIIPYINAYKAQPPLEEDDADDATKAFESAKTKKDESLRTLGFGYHGGIDSKGVGKAGNRRDLYEEIEQIKKWNNILIKEDNKKTLNELDLYPRDEKPSVDPQFGVINIRIDGQGWIKNAAIGRIKAALKGLQGERHIFIDDEEIGPY